MLYRPRSVLPGFRGRSNLSGLGLQINSPANLSPDWLTTNATFGGGSGGWVQPGGSAGNPIPSGQIPTVDPGLINKPPPLLRPPSDCVIAKHTLGAQQAAQFGMGDDPQALLASMSSVDRYNFQQGVNAWTQRYGFPPKLAIYEVSGGGGMAGFTALYAMRPGCITQPCDNSTAPQSTYDPELYFQPPFGPGDPRAAAYQLGMCLFYPDKMFQQTGPNPGGKWQNLSGSWLAASPTPYWLKCVTVPMVDYAQKFLTPPPAGIGGFGPGSTDQIGSNLKVAGAAMGTAKGALTGAALGSAVPIVGTAIGAAAGAVVGFFSSLFSWSWGDPDPPAWLVALDKMSALRTTDWYNRFSTGASDVCNVFYIANRPSTIAAWTDYPARPAFPGNFQGNGQYTILEAVEELASRFAGNSSVLGSNSWIVALIAAAAAIAAGS